MGIRPRISVQFRVLQTSDFRLQPSDLRLEEFKRETNECSPPADEDEDEDEDVGQQAVNFRFVGFEGPEEAEVPELFPPTRSVLRKTRYSFFQPPPRKSPVEEVRGASRLFSP